MLPVGWAWKSYSGPLKVHDDDGLEGLSLSVADIRAIAPLLYGLDGGGGKHRVSFDQSQALNFAILIHDGLEDNGSVGSGSASFDGILRRNGVSQPIFRTFGR